MKGECAIRKNGSLNSYVILVSFLMIFQAAGCKAAPESVEPEFVIKSGRIVVDRDEFFDELDLKLLAYPYNIKDYPNDYNTMIMDLVTGLTEQCQLMNAARQKGIAVSDQEVDQAEKRLRQDYPDDSFEQMLLENAVSYRVWKEKLRKNLVIEKLVYTQLDEAITITPDDLVSYYKTLNDGNPDGKNSGRPDEETQLKAQGEQLLTGLKREKRQVLYSEWIEQIKTAYPAQINEKEVTRFLLNPHKEKDGFDD